MILPGFSIKESKLTRLSAPPRLADNAHRGSDGKLVIIVRDPQHHLLGRFVNHLLSQDAGFFGSLAPMLWVVEMRANGHGTRPGSEMARGDSFFEGYERRGRAAAGQAASSGHHVRAS